MSSLGAVAFVVIVGSLLFLAFRTPSSAVAAVLCMFGLDQLGQATIAPLRSYPALTNVLVGLMVLTSLGRIWKDVPSRLRLAPYAYVLAWALYAYAFMSIIWTPVPAAAMLKWTQAAPYVVLGVALAPVTVANAVDVLTTLRTILFVGGALVFSLLFFAEWGTRGLLLGSESLDSQTNPLALATLGGVVALSALFTPFPSPVPFMLIFRGAVVIGSVALIVRSASRGQLVALLLATIVTIPMRFKVSRARDFIAILAIAFVVATALYIAFSDYQTGGSDRWSSVQAIADASGRMEMAEALLRKWSESWITTIFGLGTSASFDPRIVGFYPHVVPAEILGEEGLIGFILYLSLTILCVAFAWTAVRRFRESGDFVGALSTLYAMFVFAFLQSLKEGNMLGNYESFMFCVLTFRISRAFPTDLDAATSRGLPDRKSQPHPPNLLSRAMNEIRARPRMPTTKFFALAIVLAMAPPIALAESCVRIFDSTSYLHKPDLREYGIQKATTVDILRWWQPAESKDELTHSNTPEKWARGITDASVVVLDIERWPTRDARIARTSTVPMLITLIQRLKAAGLSTPVGYYAIPPIRDYWRAVMAKTSREYLEWQMENDALEPVAKYVDAIFPSLYTFYGDEYIDGWKRYATANLAEARRLSNGKPVYAYLWPEYHNSNKKLAGQFIPGPFWAVQLETVATYADGFVIWGGWANGPREWDENAPWWTATKQFIAKHQRSCTSSHSAPKPPSDLQTAR